MSAGLKAHHLHSLFNGLLQFFAAHIRADVGGELEQLAHCVSRLQDVVLLDKRANFAVVTIAQLSAIDRNLSINF